MALRARNPVVIPDCLPRRSRFSPGHRTGVGHCNDGLMVRKWIDHRRSQAVPSSGLRFRRVSTGEAVVFCAYHRNCRRIGAAVFGCARIQRKSRRLGTFELSRSHAVPSLGTAHCGALFSFQWRQHPSLLLGQYPWRRRNHLVLRPEHTTSPIGEGCDSRIVSVTRLPRCVCGLHACRWEFCAGDSRRQSRAAQARRLGPRCHAFAGHNCHRSPQERILPGDFSMAAVNCVGVCNRCHAGWTPRTMERWTRRGDRRCVVRCRGLKWLHCALDNVAGSAARSKLERKNCHSHYGRQDQKRWNERCICATNRVAFICRPGQLGHRALGRDEEGLADQRNRSSSVGRH